MTAIFYFALAVALIGGLAWGFVSTPAHRLATTLRTGLPLLIAALGGVLILAGRGGIGVPLAAIGLGLWQRGRGVGHAPSAPGRKSTVRSAALEMILDHDTGEMDGKVLSGSLEGELLSRLDGDALQRIYHEIAADRESVELLEAYLDRRMPGWREHANAHEASGQGATPGAGAMTKQEAYQVLGLEPGASKEDVRKAWRRLMKTAHPDHGGSAFLAAKINAAKEILLD